MEFHIDDELVTIVYICEKCFKPSQQSACAHKDEIKSYLTIDLTRSHKYHCHTCTSNVNKTKLFDKIDCMVVKSDGYIYFKLKANDYKIKVSSKHIYINVKTATILVKVEEAIRYRNLI